MKKDKKKTVPIMVIFTTIPSPFKLFYFSGYDGSVRVNTFHAFSFAEKRWCPVLPSANSAGPPSPRDRHVAVAFGNSFYVHGGT